MYRCYDGGMDAAHWPPCPRSPRSPASSTASSGAAPRRRDAETREASRARVAAALDGRGRLLLLKQVHGASVVEAPWEGTPEADAACAIAPGLLLGIQTADCLPVLARRPAPARRRRRARRLARHRRRASPRAPWRPSSRAGSRPRGPRRRARPRHRPVLLRGGGRAARGVRPGGRAPSSGRGRAAGPTSTCAPPTRASSWTPACAPRRSTTCDECTRCRADLYHSYRRDGAGAGRMISFVGFAGRRPDRGSRRARRRPGWRERRPRGSARAGRGRPGRARSGRGGACASRCSGRRPAFFTR